MYYVGTNAETRNNSCDRTVTKMLCLSVSVGAHSFPFPFPPSVPVPTPFFLCLSICLSVCLSLCLSVCLSLSLSLSVSLKIYFYNVSLPTTSYAYFEPLIYIYLFHARGNIVLSYAGMLSLIKLFNPNHAMY